MAKKETITKTEYLQLLGLGVIARQHYQRIIDVRDAMLAVLGTTEEEDERGGWVGDTVWNGESDIDHMLKMMEVKVSEEVDAAKS